MEILAHWVGQYGYSAIFGLLVLGIVGLPVPDEWLLTLSGYLVFKHHLNLAPTLAAAVLGSICGITISYGLGRSMGLYALHHYGRILRITPEGLQRAQARYDRFGTWLLFFGYFVPGVRHFTAVVAGTLRLPPGHFSLYAYSGALVWSSVFIGIGYLFGDEWTVVLKQIHCHLLIIACTGLSLALFSLIWFLRKKRFQN